MHCARYMKFRGGVVWGAVLLFGFSIQTRALGQPPGASVCEGLTGPALRLCSAYCEAQDCPSQPKPSCEQLRRNFAKLGGSTQFPCDPRCGDGMINVGGEQCDPPGSQCVNDRTCTSQCTCPVPACGDGIVDSGEVCDPPGTPTGCFAGLCTGDCSCPPFFTCCEFDLGGGETSCANGLTPQQCTNAGGTPGPEGFACSGEFFEKCIVPETPVCCQCDDGGVPFCHVESAAIVCEEAQCPAMGTMCNANTGLCE